jgi:hypothetical protein
LKKLHHILVEEVASKLYSLGVIAQYMTLLLGLEKTTCKINDPLVKE